MLLIRMVSSMLAMSAPLSCKEDAWADSKGECGSEGGVVERGLEEMG